MLGSLSPRRKDCQRTAGHVEAAWAQTGISEGNIQQLVLQPGAQCCMPCLLREVDAATDFSSLKPLLAGIDDLQQWAGGARG